MPRFMWFIIATAGLIVGYLIYGRFVEKVFGPQPQRPTPAITHADGVDFVAMPKWKLWLIQLLNIAGVGPVFGPIMGALYGPAALLWIVLGSIFAGAVHDYFSGMLSVRYNGANVPEIVGYNLGKIAQWVMRVFAVLLLLLVGVVFARHLPACWPNSLRNGWISRSGSASFSSTTSWPPLCPSTRSSAASTPCSALCS